jgi:hypothetical protein
VRPTRRQTGTAQWPSIARALWQWQEAEILLRDLAADIERSTSSPRAISRTQRRSMSTSCWRKRQIGRRCWIFGRCSNCRWEFDVAEKTLQHFAKHPENASAHVGGDSGGGSGRSDHGRGAVAGCSGAH